MLAIKAMIELCHTHLTEWLHTFEYNSIVHAFTESCLLQVVTCRSAGCKRSVPRSGRITFNEEEKKTQITGKNHSVCGWLTVHRVYQLLRTPNSLVPKIFESRAAGDWGAEKWHFEKA